jgi:hypothetical protein
MTAIRYLFLALLVMALPLLLTACGGGGNGY